MPPNLLPLLRAALEGRYRVDQEIGRGAAARIFAAHDPTGRAVALKVLRPELRAGIMAHRFLREIRLLSRLEHPHIAPIVDAGEQDQLIYYVMPLLDGPDLRAVLDRERRLSTEDGVRMTRDVLAALDHAHALGIMHRDVKPDNILITPAGAVLVDFGIARAIEVAASEAVTRTGITVGTAAYMSPEQIAADPATDARTDLYSLGCVLFEALAGRPPFASRHDAVVLRLHQMATPPDLQHLRPDVPRPLADAVAVALAKRPEDRWSSARAMAGALDALG
ncbi:MAG: serine/threonine-protein kinase [Gemmatimonadota bacterium]